MKSTMTLRWVAGGAAALSIIALAVAFALEPDITRSGHTFHLDVLGSACVDCHRTATQSMSAADRLIPDHDTCFDCHDGFGATDDCAACHTNYEQAMYRERTPRDVDHFPHKTHVDMGIDCRECHPDAGENVIGERVFALPDMPTCTHCHDGVKAEIMCETCHTTAALTHLLPESHRVPGWDYHHGSVARTDIKTCSPCHVQEQDCDMCHRGANIMGIPHREGFFDTHSFVFHTKQKECAACHDISSYCVDCHQQRRVMPANHSFMSWLSDHDSAAKTDLESCAACHDGSNPSCAQPGCHIGM